MTARIPRAGGYLLALAAGMGAAWWFSSHAGGGESTGTDRSVTPDHSAKVSKRAHHDTSGRSNPRHAGSAHRQAWDLLMRQPPADRKELIPLLLDEWIKRDPAAAMEAVLTEAESARWLDHFSALFDEDPQRFKELFAGERFGLKTAEVRDWWITRMAARDPVALLAQAGEFGPVAREKIAATCVATAKLEPQRLQAMIGAVASLADTPENRRAAASVARALAAHMDAQALLDRLIEIPGPAGAAMIGGAMASMLERTNLEGARETFARLPDDLRRAAVEATLAKPGKNVSGFLAAMDEVINTPEWKSLQKPLAVRLHELNPGPDQNAALLGWAARMPEREDTMDLYRVTVRSFVKNHPEQSREWIGGMAPGWKQQNSLAAYVQTSLAARQDEAGAQWAFQQITDPVFRSEAEGFFRAHEARKGTR